MMERTGMSAKVGRSEGCKIAEDEREKRRGKKEKERQRSIASERGGRSAEAVRPRRTPDRKTVLLVLLGFSSTWSR